MVVVHTLTRGRQYVAGFWSMAYLFRWFVIVCNIVFAFLIAYGTRNLWAKEGAYFERPDMQFRHIVAGIVDGDNSSFAFGTIKSYTDVFPSEHVRVPTIYASWLADDDGLAAQHTITIEIPLAATETIKSVQGVLIFDYMLQTLVRLQMECGIFFSCSNPVAGYACQIDGSVQLRPARPLAVTSAALQTGDTDLIPANTILTPADVALPQLQSRYNARNVTVGLDSVLHSWQSGAMETFTLQLNVRVPEQRVVYKPTVMEVVKFAWIQFVCIVIVLWWLSCRALDVIYEQQVFRTRVVDLVGNASGVEKAIKSHRH